MQHNLLDGDTYQKEVITIVFNEEMLKEFTGYDKDNPQEYFKLHPKAKKPPFEALWKKSRYGMIPSINVFLNCPDRRVQNSWEQHLKEYCEYCMTKQSIKHNYIEKCFILVIQFKPTKSKSDPSNLYAKPFEDAMVERELLVDDNYQIVRLHMEYEIFDKNNPHSEIRIYPIYDEIFDFEFVLNFIIQDLCRLEMNRDI